MNLPTSTKRSPSLWKVEAWFRSRWFRGALICMTILTLITGFATGAPWPYLLGEVLLSLSVYASLFFLADRPLINPLQAMVGLFYWWFGVGPTITATWDVLVGNPDLALPAQTVGMYSLWIVAPGLLLYAFVARFTLRWFSKTDLRAQFLLPDGNNYRPKTLIIYLSLMGFSTSLLTLLSKMGIHGLEELSLFGGGKTTIWWVGVIAAVGSIAPFVSSALMHALAKPWRTTPTIIKILIFIVIGQTVIFSLFGGWKAPMVILGAYFASAYLSRHQRPPWLVITIGLLVFLIFIAPFVGYARNAALMAGVDNSEMRKQVFKEVLQEPETFLPLGLKEVDVSLLFRGIYPLAGEITRRNNSLKGEWHGSTITWGLETLVPRVFDPNKPDADIGNFFSRSIGADLGITRPDDTLTNLAISIPFEFVGNYGWLTGILSFGMIGWIWTTLTVWILTPGRLSDHPLTPFLVLSVLHMESSFGGFLATLRGLLIPLALCYLTYRLLNSKI